MGNSPLHVAVNVGVESSVISLLRYDADPSQKNWRGDKPSEFLGWPRCGGAARACRRLTRDAISNPQKSQINSNADDINDELLDLRELAPRGSLRKVVQA